jgi:hypothetical protein
MSDKPEITEQDKILNWFENKNKLRIITKVLPMKFWQKLKED